MSLATQIFCLPFWIILIKYKFQKEKSIVSAELKRAVGDSQAGGCTFSGMLFQRAASCECAAAGFSVLNNLHSETAKSSIFMGWWDHPWHAATSASSLFTPHPSLCKFQVLISWEIVGLPFEAELLQWNREDPSWIILGQRVNCACWEIPIAADVWETGADHSFPDSALPWWIQHSCSDLFVHSCFTGRGSHTLFFSRNCHFVFRQSLLGTNVHTDVFSLRS